MIVDVGVDVPSEPSLELSDTNFSISIFVNDLIELVVVHRIHVHEDTDILGNLLHEFVERPHTLGVEGIVLPDLSVVHEEWGDSLHKFVPVNRSIVVLVIIFFELLTTGGGEEGG